MSYPNTGFGKPGFLSTHTSLPEIGSDAAFYFENFEPKTMQNAFVKGIEAFKINDMQQKVITHALQFDWQETAQQYLKLYDECLGL